MQKFGLFSIRLIRLSDHGRIPVLMRNQTGLPVMLVARYTANELWNKESENTSKLRLSAIKAFYEWALSLPTESFDPDLRLTEPDSMDQSLIASFAQYLKLRRKHRASVPVTDRNRSTEDDFVDGKTVSLYLTLVKDFVVWAAVTQALPKMSDERVDTLKRWFAEKSQSFYATCHSAPQGLPVEWQNRLRETCRPESAQNPFNRPVRYRNQALIHLMLNTPLRRGELAGLRLQDMQLTGGNRYSVSVVVQDKKSSSTAFDERLNRPRQKTRGREMPIVGATKDALIAYLRHERPARSKSPFFFLGSRTGKPLSLTGINSIFAQILRSFKDELPRFHPHLTRHTFNYNFKLHNVDTKLQAEQARQVLNYLNGWSDASIQANAYGSAANVIIADRIVGEMHAKIAGKTKGD